MFGEFRNLILKTLALSAVGVGLYYLIPKMPDLADDLDEPEVREEFIVEQKNEKKFKKKMQIARSPASLLNNILEREEPDEPREEIRDDITPVTSVVSGSSAFNSGGSTSSEVPRSSGNSNKEITRSDSQNESETLTQKQTDPPKDQDTCSIKGDCNDPPEPIPCSVAGNCPVPEPTPGPSPDPTPDPSPEPSPASCAKPIIATDKGSGNYSSNPNVALSSDSGGDIYYCLSAGACCDPSSSGTLYTGALPVGAADGNYCLTYYGVNTSCSLDGDQSNQAYLVDSTLPDLISTADVQYIQTTERPTITINSAEFLNPGYDYGLYYLPLDPVALTCAQVETNYVHATYGIDFDGDATPDFYDLGVEAGSLVKTFKSSDMNYGVIGNFFSSILGNRNLATDKLSCTTHKIILMDFDYFDNSNSTTAAAPLTGSVREMTGSFGSYGFFRAPAAVNDFNIKNGSSRHVDGDPLISVLETTAAEIMN